MVLCAGVLLMIFPLGFVLIGQLAVAAIAELSSQYALE
jgi:hypothetical protein